MRIKKSLTTLILIIVILVIWIYNLLLVKNLPVQPEQSANKTFDSKYIDSLPLFNFEYKDIKRDPFNVILDTTPKETVKPVFTLKGVVLSQGESSALMEIFNETYLLRKNETCVGIKIKEITPKSVTIEFRGKEEILKLWE